MSLLLRLSILLCLVVGSARPALAAWVVSQVSQPARYAVDGRTWRQVMPDMELADGAWIHTGRRGRVILRQAGDTIQFKPNTVAAISDRNPRGGRRTTVLQKFGTVLLDLEPGRANGAAVQTPFLAAIVKGTRFEVDVRLDRVAVGVSGGTVTTTDLLRGLRVDVRPGQRAVVGDGDGPPLTVTGRGPRAPIVRVTPPPPLVDAARAAASARAGESASPEPLWRSEDDGEAQRDWIYRVIEAQVGHPRRAESKPETGPPRPQEPATPGEDEPSPSAGGAAPDAPPEPGEPSAPDGDGGDQPVGGN